MALQSFTDWWKTNTGKLGVYTQKQTRGQPECRFETVMSILACMLGSWQLDFHLCSSIPFPFNICVEWKTKSSQFI